MTYYLGIYGGLGTTNASAALLKDKQIIAFAEEERFTRIKNAPSALPVNAIFYCLKKANIKIKYKKEGNGIFEGVRNKKFDKFIRHFNL